MASQIAHQHLATLDKFSMNAESNINSLINIRNFLSTIKTYGEFDSSKPNIISDLFEIEDCLRATYDYLKEIFFEERNFMISQQAEQQQQQAMPPICTDQYMPKKDISDDLQMKSSFYFNYNDDESVSSLYKSHDKSPSNIFQNDNCNNIITQGNSKDNSNKYYNKEENSTSSPCLMINNAHANANANANAYANAHANANVNANANAYAHANANEKQFSLNDNHNNDIPNKVNYSQQNILKEMQNAATKQDDYNDNDFKIKKNRIDKNMSNLYSPSFNNEIDTINNLCEGNSNINSNSNDNNNALNTISSIQKDTIYSMNSKQRASRVADLIMKINSNEDLYEMMGQIFSNTILDDLISSKANDALICSVEEAVREIEKLQLKDSINNSNSNSNNYNYNDKGKDNDNNQQLSMKNNNNMTWIQLPKPKQSANKQLSLNKSACKQSFINNKKSFEDVDVSSGKKRNFSKELQNKYPKTIKGIIGRDVKPFVKETNFETSLRAGCTSPQLKVFNNYTTARSGYFDPSLQNGGQSKLSFQKRNLKGRKECRPMNSQYINYTLHSANSTGYQFTKSYI